MTPIQINVPEALSAQKAELETTLAGIATEELKLAVQRKEIQAALQSINTAVAVLSGQPLSASKDATPTGRKPMSPEARQRIAEGIRKSARAKAAAKAAQLAASAPPAPGQATADVPVADTPGKPGSARKTAKE